MRYKTLHFLMPFLFSCLALCLPGKSVAQVGGPGGLHTTPLYAAQTIDAGLVSLWNTSQALKIKIETSGDWLIANVHIYAGYPEDDPIPMTKKGDVRLGHFPYKMEYETPVPGHLLILDLKDDLEFSWGSKFGERRHPTFAVHADLVKLDAYGEVIAEEGAWAYGPHWFENQWGWYASFNLAHPLRGQFIDAPVQGLSYHGPTQQGVTGQGTADDEAQGGFLFFPDEDIDFAIGSVPLGTAKGAKKVSPLDLYPGADTGDPCVVGVAQVLQSLDANGDDGKIVLLPEVVACFEGVAADQGFTSADYCDSGKVASLTAAAALACDNLGGADLAAVSAEEAQGNLEAGLNASGIFRKNVSKTEDWGETKQKLEVMPVYFPGKRSDGSPSFCDMDGNGLYEEGIDQLGVPYEEWRLGGDPFAEECDPRDYEDESCVITLIECRDVAKPLIVTYLEKINIYDDQVTTGFWQGRFAWDTFTAVSRDDGTTWKRMNVSRMADLSSFDLETGEPFPGTTGSPYLKVNDNYILVVWESKFCKSGNPRYAINRCDDPTTEEVEADDPETPENECAVYCRGNAEQGTEVCEPDYPYDDAYYVTDIWGVRGQQQSVDYNEVDDVADLGIGEIPYSCLWAARGVIVTQKDIDEGKFASLTVEDDPVTDASLCDAVGNPFECCTGVETGDCDESDAVVLGDIVWFKPERLTSGRRDVYIPMVGSARGAGFAIAWQEDPSGLRPGKGKGPGEGWSGAISNHKTDIWYSYITYEDFSRVDGNFIAGGPPEDGGPEDKTGLGRPKALVPFSLPVRISDNDMVNTNTLKVEQSSNCVTPPGGTEPVCFPAVEDGSFVPMDTEEIAIQFCDHPEANQDTCCDPDDHQGDPNCEDLKGLYGNLTGTKRYAYLARTLDDNGDGYPDYQYYVDRGGTLDLCDLSGANTYMEELPGTSAHERWLGFTNVAGASKLVCVTSDGRLLDGDVSASRPMLQLQPYTRPDGTKSAWALLGYEESKGMGHSLAAQSHEDTDNPVDEIIGVKPEDPGQDKPIKQDIGKNTIYHSFDYTQPDLVAPGHIVNLPALCGGLYPNYCGDAYDGENPTCTCELGQPIPLYFDYQQCADPEDLTTCEWMPDDTKLLQYRTEIARRIRFIMQSGSKAKATVHKTLGAMIYKQGQEGQGRPADVFIRRMVLPDGINLKTDNPFAFENFVCTKYLDETFELPECPNGAGDKDSAVGYNCNVWGEAYGDRLCGGEFEDSMGYLRRDHINLTSHDIELAVDAGPEDDTPDDPTDDIYGTEKVLLWSQYAWNLNDESYGVTDTSTCDLASCAGMYSNARSHRGFIRGDFFATAYSMSPNWAAARNGNDRYNFYVRRSFDGGQTWTTSPAGEGVYVCPEWRSDPTNPADDPNTPEDETGNLPPPGIDPLCDPCPYAEDGICIPTESAIFYPAGAFEPARNVSEIDNNKESSGDPRIGTTPPTYPLDGRVSTLPILRFEEDEYVDNMFFVAWGTVDNPKSTGSEGVKPEGAPLDLFYTRSEDYGDTYFKIPWIIGGVNSNEGVGEIVWRYDFMAKGEPEEQGECQLRATSDGSKVYAIYHSAIAEEADPEEIYTRWYPWKPEVSYENDLWFRRVIFWPDAVEPY